MQKLLLVVMAWREEKVKFNLKVVWKQLTQDNNPPMTKNTKDLLNSQPVFSEMPLLTNISVTASR
jgi:hypothetical protein